MARFGTFNVSMARIGISPCDLITGHRNMEKVSRPQTRLGIDRSGRKVVEGGYVQICRWKEWGGW